MSVNYDYNVPVLQVAQSNSTRITKKIVTFKNCTWDLLQGCTGWNFDKCPNDDDYCQPYIVGDKMFMQYKIPASWGSVAAIEMINSPSGESVAFGSSLAAQIGKDADGIRYLNISIDTNELPEGVSCFYLKVSMWDCRSLIVPSQGFTNCVVTKILAGKSQAEATIECANTLCGEQNKKIIYSEPYCAIRCEEPSMVIKGEYPKYDCDGYYYDDLLNVSTGATMATIYELNFRIRAFIENDGYEFGETNVNGKITKVSTKKKYTLYSEKIPPYVAAQIARAAGSKLFTIDDEEYNRPTNLNKEFDQGLSWIPKLVLTKECHDLDLTCE